MIYWLCHHFFHDLPAMLAILGGGPGSEKARPCRRRGRPIRRFHRAAALPYCGLLRTAREINVYVPPAFQETRLSVLHAAIRAVGLPILVTAGPEGIVASHVPMLLDDADGPNGTLLGHIARANNQWQRSAADVAGLAIFPGPDAYISPSAYATKRETGKVVPTWNYIAVHAYGTLAFFDDPTELHALVSRLTVRHESGRAAPWAVTDAPADFIASQLKGIVGFRLAIARLEGKWKLSQNRPMADRLGVIEALEEGGPAAAAVADAVAATLPG
jgi:transcriptional regulator